MAEPEWDTETRAWADALGHYRDSLCVLCGRPRAVCQAAENEDAFETDLPVRCHATTAQMQAQSQIDEETTPHPRALLIPTILKEG